MKKIILINMMLLASVFSFAQTDGKLIDQIAAVVNDEIILQSEVDLQAQYYAYVNKKYAVSEEIWNQVLENMISQKLLLAKAKLDSIQISGVQVDRAIDQRIEYLSNRLGSEQAVRDYYKKSIMQIRNELRETVRKEMMVEQIKQKEFGKIGITYPEVVEFYNLNKDSMEVLPASADLYQIFIYPLPTNTAKELSLNKVKMILDSLKNGASFEEMAKRYSEDGTASRGGDLGFSKRGEFVPQYEEAAYKLNPGELSGVVESQFGYHIIKMVERRGENIHTKHILIKADKQNLDHQAALDSLNLWREEILSGKETFENIAVIHSKDEFASKGGFIGRVPLSELDENFQRAIETLSNNEVSLPAQFQLQNGELGYHIIRVKNKLPEHKMNLTDDYERLQAMALDNKRNEFVENWINNIKKEVFLEIRAVYQK